MRLLKPVLLFVILAASIALIIILYNREVGTPLQSTFAPLFQLLGEPVKGVDVAATKLLPIDEFDEKEYGDCMASYYGSRADSGGTVFIYLNSLLTTLVPFSDKPFTYRVFVLHGNIPNACALPGGVILVTEGLLDVLETEGELVSVLAHEMGHIECGHCFETVKFELLSKKIDAATVGKIADFLSTLFLRHAYSKTQEAEADAFAFKAIIRTAYSPSSVAGSFVCLERFVESSGDTSGGERSADLLRDYFMSHPPLQLRASKYEADAKRWWTKNSGARRYVGKKNLNNRVSFLQKPWDDEWTTSAQLF
jgi:predicted Zn-dependent protease